MSDEKGMNVQVDQSEVIRQYRELARIHEDQAHKLAEELAAARCQIARRDRRIDELDDKLTAAGRDIGTLRVMANDAADTLIQKRGGRKAPKWAWNEAARLKNLLFGMVRKDRA